MHAYTIVENKSPTTDRHTHTHTDTHTYLHTDYYCTCGSVCVCAWCVRAVKAKGHSTDRSAGYSVSYPIQLTWIIGLILKV